MDAQDVARQPAWIKSPEGEYGKAGAIGHLLIRAAWRLLHQKAPQLAGDFDGVKVEVLGPVRVSFFKSSEEMLETVMEEGNGRG